MSDRADRWRALSLAALAVLAFAAIPASTGSPTPTVPPETGEQELQEATRPSAGDPTASVESIHEDGLTGEGTAVGVVGRSFTPEAGGVQGETAASRQFASTRQLGGVVHPRRSAHDTAVAEIVSETAPSANLYLAGVGDSPSPEQYRAAVGWLLDSDVDVIVDAASYFPSTAEGAGEITGVAEAAADAGVVFVTSAGNYGQRTWTGGTDSPGWVAFADGTEGNRLGDGPIEGRVSLRLYWESDANLDLYLYRDRPGSADPVVAKSVRDSGGAEALDAVVPEGKYYVAVHAADGVAGDVELFSVTHRLRHATPTGGLAPPADGEGVIAVGGADGDSVASYSSRGPDVDVAAPDGAETDAAGRLHGTSAAAPLVAGTTALIEAHGETDLSPEEVAALLENTAADDDDGRLRLDPGAALDALDAGGANATRIDVGTADAAGETSTVAGAPPGATADAPTDRTTTTSGDADPTASDEPAATTPRPDAVALSSPGLRIPAALAWSSGATDDGSDR